MKISDTVKQFLKEEGRTNLLATSDGRGRVNLATFGSLQLLDDGSLMFMLGDNRSYANLQENPHAACMVTLHGKTGFQAEGCRLYLKVREMKDEGQQLQEAQERLRARIGGAADMLRHLVRFDIVEARPILDLGQGV